MSSNSSSKSSSKSSKSSRSEKSVIGYESSPNSSKSSKSSKSPSPKKPPSKPSKPQSRFKSALMKKLAQPSKVQLLNNLRKLGYLEPDNFNKLPDRQKKILQYIGAAPGNSIAALIDKFNRLKVKKNIRAYSVDTLRKIAKAKGLRTTETVGTKGSYKLKKLTKPQLVELIMNNQPNLK